jgi:superfamily II DNA or RNA helicase
MTIDTTGLLEPQIAHAQRLVDSLYLNGVAADLSETGCGKTYAASAISRAMNCPIIVIAPKMVLPVWDRILKKFGVQATILINYEKVCRGNTIHLKYLRSKKVERWMNAKIKFPAGSLVILDESHKCKGFNSLNAGMLIALKRQGYRVLCLSASQATNPLEMKAFGFAFNLHNIKDFKSFCKDYGAEDEGRWGAQIFNLDDKEAQAKMKNLHENLFNVQKIASRLTRADMGALFPENEVIAEAYDMGKNSKLIQNAYDRMEVELIKLEESCQNYSENILAVITKERRTIEMLKVPTLLEMIHNLYKDGKSVACFVNYTETIQVLREHLNKDKEFQGKIGMIYGGNSVKNRIEDVDNFNADKLRIMLCNLAAGGQSINLHDLNGKYPRATIINPSYSAINLLQALGRICRQGGLTKCLQYLVYASGTREERMCYKVQYKLNNLSILNDGDLIDNMRLFRHIMGKSL